LGSGRLAPKTPGFEGWKSLDFLGFSRPDRAFSMGYVGFLLKEKSRALLRPRHNRENGSMRFWPAERNGLVMSKLNSISDFLQEIAA
jgi:hypothetical protein